MGKNPKKLITIDRLAKLSDTKISAITRYLKEGVLAFEKEDNKLSRYFNEKEAKKTIKEIKRLLKMGHSFSKIKEYFMGGLEYSVRGVRFENEPATIEVSRRGEVIRRISSNSKEGKKLIKAKRIKYPEHILILPKRKRDNQNLARS